MSEKLKQSRIFWQSFKDLCRKAKQSFTSWTPFTVKQHRNVSQILTQAGAPLGNPISGFYDTNENILVRTASREEWNEGNKREIGRKKERHCISNLPSCPELWRCSPRSQPNTLSLRIPRCRNFWGGGRDFINVLRKVTSFPCFLHTD